MTVRTISLCYREGSSDKEYHVTIEPKDQGYVVNFAFGRRSSTLNTGTKTTTSVDLDTATSIFDKLVREKKAKGYTEGENGTPYQHTDKEERVTGLQCQLLNPILEAAVDELLEDDAWCAQEKYDGKRILVQKHDAAVHGINRKGLITGIPSTLVLAAKAFTSSFIIDGECIGNDLYVFDLLQWDGEDLRARRYQDRVTALFNLLAGRQQRHIHFADTAWSTKEKNDLLRRLQAEKKEGIVFKRLDASYTAGRPNSGGTQLKHKFYATVSAVVGKVNRQRSVELRLISESGPVMAGNVTVPANHSIPKVGQVVEIRYLYAFRESGCLYQPVFLGVRTDLLPGECTTAQLKFKNGEEEA